jgi:hypothetical protein
MDRTRNVCAVIIWKDHIFPLSWCLSMLTLHLVLFGHPAVIVQPSASVLSVINQHQLTTTHCMYSIFFFMHCILSCFHSLHF